MVFCIKFLHSVLFLAMEGLLAYIIYCGITNETTLITWVGVGAMMIEGLVLYANHWRCPLTIWAERHGAENGSVTGFFLPHFLVPQVFRIFGALFVLGLLLLLL